MSRVAVAVRDAWADPLPEGDGGSLCVLTTYVNPALLADCGAAELAALLQERLPAAARVRALWYPVARTPADAHQAVCVMVAGDWPAEQDAATHAAPIEQKLVEALLAASLNR